MIGFIDGQNLIETATYFHGLQFGNKKCTVTQLKIAQILFKKLRKFLLGITLNPKSDKTTVFNSEYLSQTLSTQMGPMYSNAFWKGPKQIYMAFYIDATL